MLRTSLAAVVLSIVVLAPVRPAQAAIDVHVDIGNAPPPPTIVIRSAPHVVLDRPSGVYVIEDSRWGDYDGFRYGGYYWVFQDGYWYRARSWSNRFVVVRPSLVPVALYRVSEPHWKHGPAGPPPGLANKPGGMPPGQYKKMQGGGNGRGHGHGH